MQWFAFETAMYTSWSLLCIIFIFTTYPSTSGLMRRIVPPHYTITNIHVNQFKSIINQSNFKTSLQFSITDCIEGDVVQYDHNGIKKLGVIGPKQTVLFPLCVRDNLVENLREIELFYDEEQDPITISSVVVEQVVNDAFYTQRTIEDRISNPHGEHAEDVWIIENKLVISDIRNNKITVPLGEGH